MPGAVMRGRQSTKKYEVWVRGPATVDEPLLWTDFRFNAAFDNMDRAHAEKDWYEARGYRVLVVHNPGPENG